MLESRVCGEIVLMSSLLCVVADDIWPACINVDLGLARMNAGLENGVGLEKQRDRANGHRGPTTFRPVPSFFSALLLSQSISSPAFSAPALGGRAVHVLLTKIMSISRPTHFASAV